MKMSLFVVVMSVSNALLLLKWHCLLILGEKKTSHPPWLVCWGTDTLQCQFCHSGLLEVQGSGKAGESAVLRGMRMQHSRNPTLFGTVLPKPLTCKY